MRKRVAQAIIMLVVTLLLAGCAGGTEAGLGVSASTTCGEWLQTTKSERIAYIETYEAPPGLGRPAPKGEHYTVSKTAAGAIASHETSICALAAQGSAIGSAEELVSQAQEDGVGLESTAATAIETSTSTSSSQTVGGNCGEELSGNAHASCPFVREVFKAVKREYEEDGQKAPSTVTAHSPATGKTYTLRCSEGEEIKCVTGTSVVTFPKSKL